ncbi:MAG: hypothetical protein MN733_11795 [Nitrososphaera sp.]|nr:hypothetical protein [Nitrososphaera sp.]
MKKTPIVVAVVLVFGLFAAAFSLAPAIAQYDPTNPTTSASTNTTNTTGTGNATGTNATTTAAEGSTFSARGSIAAIIIDVPGLTEDNATQTETSNETGTTGNMTSLDNSTLISQTIGGGNETSLGNATTMDNATTSDNATTTTAEEPEPPYIVSGDWSLDAQDGDITSFTADFTMIHTDGSGRHTHDVSNFEASNSSQVELVEDGLTFIFGTADVSVNGEERWSDVSTLILIEKLNAVSIALKTDDDHFKGQPLFGIVDSLTDENGNEMIETTQTAQTGNTTSGNLTGGVEGAMN